MAAGSMVQMGAQRGTVARVQAVPAAGPQRVSSWLRSGVLERISMPYRSSEDVASTATITSFFTRANPTAAQGNYLAANSLPNPNRLEVHAISVRLPATITAADVKLLLDSGHLTVKLNQKEFITRVNLVHFPAGGGISGNDSTAATSVLSNGFASPHNLHVLEQPFEIMPTERFECWIDWASLSALAATRNVEVAFWGPLSRKLTG